MLSYVETLTEPFIALFHYLYFQHSQSPFMIPVFSIFFWIYFLSTASSQLILLPPLPPPPPCLPLSPPYLECQ